MERKILKYNNKQNKFFNKILDEKKKYKIIFDKQNRLCVQTDNKTILSGDYNFYGIYQENTKLWIWATSIPGVPTNHLKTIRKIRKNDHLFENSHNVKDNFYYQLLTQDVLLINNKQMLSWINELLLYLTNNIFYFNPTNENNNIQFLSLINIKEKYF